uniref:Uncharacterized protein n=1 Tax=Anopheles albimanus TaxID=7167 RepID=A0A182FWZ8_ANOAL
MEREPLAGPIDANEAARRDEGSRKSPRKSPNSNANCLPYAADARTAYMCRSQPHQSASPSELLGLRAKQRSTEENQNSAEGSAIEHQKKVGVW